MIFLDLDWTKAFLDSKVLGGFFFLLPPHVLDCSLSDG